MFSFKKLREDPVNQSSTNHSGLIPGSSWPNVDVSLSKTLNSKLFIVCISVTCKSLWIKTSAKCTAYTKKSAELWNKFLTDKSTLTCREESKRKKDEKENSPSYKLICHVWFPVELKHWLCVKRATSPTQFFLC